MGSDATIGWVYPNGTGAIGPYYLGGYSPSLVVPFANDTITVSSIQAVDGTRH